MATPIKMPQLSDTMDSGKILNWHKKEGDRVERGDSLAEVETDKANLEIEAFQPGTLLKVVIAAGAAARVGEVIAYIGEVGEQLPSSQGTGAAPTSKPSVSEISPAGRESVKLAAQPPVTNRDQARIKASPLARKLAEERQIDLRQIPGSGPEGRIVKRDLERHLHEDATASAAPTATRHLEAVPTTTRTAKLTPFSGMRATIAKRMQQSVVEAPHFYTTASVEMSEAIRLREHLKEQADYKGISVGHLVLKATAYALAREPRVNRAVRETQIYEPESINLGIITAVDDGLLIPVIREADQLSLRDLTFEARAAVDRARAGRPTSADLTGGTFSVSNMGMFDVENFTAIINPGQGAILAVSSIRPTPIVRNEQLEIGQVMRATLSVDHRIIDGVMSAQFLTHFRKALEMPALLMKEA